MGYDDDDDGSVNEYPELSLLTIIGFDSVFDSGLFGGLEDGVLEEVLRGVPPVLLYVELFSEGGRVEGEGVVRGVVLL